MQPGRTIDSKKRDPDAPAGGYLQSFVDRRALAARFVRRLKGQHVRQASSAVIRSSQSPHIKFVSGLAQAFDPHDRQVYFVLLARFFSASSEFLVMACQGI
jgi:hypothetical protein